MLSSHTLPANVYNENSEMREVNIQKHHLTAY